MSVRLRAIRTALFFAFVPYRFYEATPHCPCSYLSHMWLNLKMAATWALRRETDEDHVFEWSVNTNA